MAIRPASPIRSIVEHLQEASEVLPNGDRLTPERFLQLGIPFGYAGSMETVHYLVEIAFAPLRGKRQLSYEFLRGVYQALHFDTNLFTPCFTSRFTAKRLPRTGRRTAYSANPRSLNSTEKGRCCLPAKWFTRGWSSSTGRCVRLPKPRKCGRSAQIGRACTSRMFCGRTVCRQ